MHAPRPLAFLVVAAISRAALAQCPELELDFAAPRGDPIRALAVFDAGAGPRLCAGASTGVTTWDGTDWELAPGGPNGPVNALLVHDFGAGPELVAAGAFVLAGAQRIARWDGATWRAIGAGFDATVRALAVHDFGAGPELVAGGYFASSGGAPVARVARFDGTAWLPIGGGLDGGALAFAVVDFGSGPTLHVGGEGVVAGAHLARWNGASWAEIANGPDASVEALLAIGAPGARELVVGGRFEQVGALATQFVARFDGAGFAPCGPGLAHSSVAGGVSALLADGAGFVAGGRFETIAAPGPVSTNVARWDGASWQPLAGGLGTASFVGVDACARFDPADGGGARIFAAGGFAPQPGQPRAIAQWDGSAWSGLRDDDAQGLVHEASQDGATSATLWQGDLVIAGEFEGVADASDARGVARWDGVRWSALGNVPAWTHLDHPTLVRTVDLGAGPELVLGMSRWFTHDALVPLYRWNGASWLPFEPGALAPETSTRVSDVAVLDEGAGPRLFAGGSGLRAQSGGAADAVVRWDGAAWTRVGNGPALPPNGYVLTLETYDDGSGPALYVGGSITGGVQRWDGSTWSVVGAGLGAAVQALAAFDDGSGAKLYAGGLFQQAGGAFAGGIARWNGAAWEPVPGIGALFLGAAGFAVHDDGAGSGARLYAMSANDDVSAFDGATWTPVVSTEPYFTAARIAAFDALPGGPGIVLHGNFRDVFRSDGPLVAQAGFTILRSCPAVESFCAGDGLDAGVVACPCANVGAAGRGCAWSASGAGLAGARLAHAGAPAADDLVLVADGMPASGSSLFFQGSTANPTGAVFGDGLRCAAGTLLRLRTRTNVGGVAQVPATGEPTLATIAGASPGSGSVRAYQVWFRVAAPFCTSAPFNLTNALRVRW